MYLCPKARVLLMSRMPADRIKVRMVCGLVCRIFIRLIGRKNYSIKAAENTINTEWHNVFTDNQYSNALYKFLCGR